MAQDEAFCTTQLVYVDYDHEALGGRGPDLENDEVTPIKGDYRDLPIHDMRLVDSDIDNTGFAILPASSATVKDDDWTPENVEHMYIPRLIELVKEMTGQEDVYVDVQATWLRHVNGAGKILKPAFAVHVDFTPTAAYGWVLLMLAKSGKTKEEREELLKKRVRVFHAWKPIHHPAYDVPLALIDGKTFKPDRDCLPVLIRPANDPKEKCYAAQVVKFHPEHRWYSIRSHRPDEILIWKGFDSDSTKCAVVPHSAFKNPDYFDRTEERSRECGFRIKPRESVETRVVVFGP